MQKVKFMALAAAAALVATAAGAEEILKVVGSKTRVQPTEPSGWGVRAPAMPDGEAEQSLTPDDFCCRFDAPPGGCDLPGPYNVGDSVALSTYWEDTVPDPAPANWVVTWSQAVAPDGAPPPLVVLSANEPVNFGPVPPGTYTFCVANIATVPPGAAGLCNIGLGFRVTTPTGSIPGTLVDDFGVNPCP